MKAQDLKEIQTAENWVEKFRDEYKFYCEGGKNPVLPKDSRRTTLPLAREMLFMYSCEQKFDVMLGPALAWASGGSASSMLSQSDAQPSFVHCTSETFTNLMSALSLAETSGKLEKSNFEADLWKVEAKSKSLNSALMVSGNTLPNDLKEGIERECATCAKTIEEIDMKIYKFSRLLETLNTAKKELTVALKSI